MEDADKRAEVESKPAEAAEKKAKGRPKKAEAGDKKADVAKQVEETVKKAEEEAKPAETAEKKGKGRQRKAEAIDKKAEEEAKPADVTEKMEVEAKKVEVDTKKVEMKANEAEVAEKKAEDKATKKAEEKAKKAEEKSKQRKESSLTSGMDFSHDCQSSDGRKPNLKIASWNINGLRAWLDKGGLSYLRDEKPDVLCLQETKCSQEDIPDDVKVDGYYDYWSSADKAGYAGTAIYTKVKPIKVTYGLGIDKHDDEGRTITAEYEKFFLVTTYVPNSGRGLPRLPYRSKEWDVDFKSYLNNLNKTKPVIMCGDLNVAHLEIDLANPKTNKKTAGFTNEERQGMTDLLAEGYIDSYRELHPDTVGAYTFWTYMGNARAKNVGWRLDYFVLSERLKQDLCDNVIRKDVMGSDHCPIVLFMAMK